MKLSIATAVAFLAGFAIAWLAKSVTAQVTAEPTPAPRMRVERSAHATTRPAAVKPTEFFQRMQEAGDDTAKLKAVMAGLTSAQYPGVLAEFQRRAGLYGLDYPEKSQMEEVVNTWHAKAPEAALAWVQGLPKADDRKRLLGRIAVGLAETDLNGALALLQQRGGDEKGRSSIPFEILQKAIAQGADKFVEICMYGLNNRGSTSTGNPLTYPDSFDFQRALDGLAEAQTAFDKGGHYETLPDNLVEEWTKRDPQAAWAWLQQGKGVTFNGKDKFFKVYAKTATPVEVGSLLASAFDPAASGYLRYEDALQTLSSRPSPELLDGFLQAAPGERVAHLQGLFDQVFGWGGGNSDEARALLLGRMTSAQRVEVLRRIDSRRISDEQRIELTPVLLRLGHSEEEIRRLLPPRE